MAWQKEAGEGSRGLRESDCSQTGSGLISAIHWLGEPILFIYVFPLSLIPLHLFSPIGNP